MTIEEIAEMYNVDSGDPQNIIVSASQSAWQAYSSETAESLVYKICRRGGG